MTFIPNCMPNKFYGIVTATFCAKGAGRALLLITFVASTVVISSPSLAESLDTLVVNERTTIERADTVTDSTEITPDTASSASNSTSNNVNAVSASIDDSRAARQALSRIITSDAYATEETIETWEPIEEPSDDLEGDSWLRELLESWFDGDSSFDADTIITIFSFLLKVLLVAALIGFIIWVMRRAGYLSGWVNPLNKGRRRRSRVSSRSDNVAQNWDELPEHDRIPATVNAYLAKDQITEAASILYRGSLRWLVNTQRISIAPANTEKQCLAQIQQLDTLVGTPSHHYVSSIINLWVQSAYDSSARRRGTNSLKQQLAEQAEHWLQQLPPNFPTELSSESFKLQTGGELNGK